jgi:hypothetical protein
LNRGDTWTASPDLTKKFDRNTNTLMGVPGDRTMLSKNDGVTAYSTIISISESPVMPGVVWAGTDDGLVQVSRDGGATFTEVGKGLPGLPANHMHWVSRIDASHFDPATAYVAVDGHRSNDLKPYLFVTRDYGATWQSIASDLPQFGNIQVVREDPKNPDLLYVGTEFGLYLSHDRGKSWKKFMNGLPSARVDDILIHPRDNDLIVATHARGVYILDDISPLQQLGTATSQDVALFDIRPAVQWMNDRQAGQQTAGQKMFRGENPARGAAIHFYLKGPGEARIAIADVNGHTVRNITAQGTAGINRVLWNFQPDQQQGQAGGRGGGGGGGRGGGGGLPPGTYIVKLTAGGKTVTKPLTVLQDIWMNER